MDGVLELLPFMVLIYWVISIFQMYKILAVHKMALSKTEIARELLNNVNGQTSDFPNEYKLFDGEIVPALKEGAKDLTAILISTIFSCVITTFLSVTISLNQIEGVSDFSTLFLAVVAISMISQEYTYRRIKKTEITLKYICEKADEFIDILTKFQTHNNTMENKSNETGR